MPMKNCLNCGKEFYVFDCVYERRKFCCRDCKSKYQQKPNNIIIKDDYAEMIIKKHDKEFIVLIDIEDIPIVNTVKWMLKYDKTIDNYYVTGWERNNYKNRKTLRLHNLLTSPPKGMETDHIDRNPLNNRKSNLRVVEPVINKQNKGFYRNNKSGYKYIHWAKLNQRWIVEVKRFNKVTRVGSSKDLMEAVKIRDNYCKENGIVIC